MMHPEGVKFYSVMSNGSAQILEAEGIKVGGTYKLIEGWFAGELMKVRYIAPYKQLTVHGSNIRHRQVSGDLLNGQGQVNPMIKSLIDPAIDIRRKPAITNPMKTASNKIVIKLAKSGNRKAVQEFVRRFKKKPNFSK